MKKLLKNLNLKIIFIILFLGIVSLITLSNINILLDSSIAGINFFNKQLIGFILGVIGVVIIYNIDIKLAKPIIDIFYFILIGMLFILAFPIPFVSSLFVNNSHGANGWFMFFIPKLSFQPVEFFKVLLILKLANISSSYLKSSLNDDYIIKQYLLYGFLPILLVLIEPDLGGSLLLFFATSIMLLVSLKNKKVLKTFLLIILGLFLFVSLTILSSFFRDFLVMITPLKAYQLSRIDAWIDPFNVDIGYQLSQSLTLMGSAGPFGYGPDFNYIAIPEAHTDLIFPAIVGFWGWILGLLIILSYFLLTFETLNIAKRKLDFEYKMICIGFAALLFIQVFENIGMLVGLLPITGIVLPFLSYGVSALLTYFVVFGIILNISSKHS